MIRGYSRKSLAIGIPGIVLQLVFYVSIPSLISNDPGLSSIATQWVAIASVVAPAAGTVLFIIGLCYYAKAKGYNGSLGFLGMLSCVGLLIIALLPDRTKKRAGPPPLPR
ncbi:MAG: hypothetical protein ABI651_04460 [Verrucomicrobiota bacterium]